MSFGTSTNDAAYVFVALLLALFVPLVVIGVGWLIGRVFGVRGGAFPLVFLLVVGASAIVGGSLYLDQVGRTIQGRVITKNERVTLRQQGDWERELSATLRYRLDGTLPEGEFAHPDDATTILRLSGPQFDALRENDTPQLKVLPLWRSVTLVRLPNVSTRDFIPWMWIGLGVGALVLAWLASKIARWRAGQLAIMLVVILVAVGVPGAIVYREWQASENLAAKPLRATVTVQEVTRVTRIDPMPCEQGSCDSSQDTAFDVPQQYDIVQMRFTPAGGRDAVLAIDAADAGSVQAQSGSAIDIAYAANDPRSAQIIGATHGHHWKNMIAFLGIELAGLVALFVLVSIASSVGGRLKRVAQQARTNVKTNKP